ncbi:anti-sigma factor family protein [Paenibacillus gansuensis]|uniref:Anti-sigma factor family protein n=1 Tax=Paenibacillus gansuensis TaxID=306542 RepID=A0ABW5PC41_9BACL
MNCEEIQDLLGTYWDLPEEDPQRELVNRHLQTCRSCSEEFEIWRESEDLIQVSALIAERPSAENRIVQSVMDRIYAEESWKLPAHNRIYNTTYKWRRNVSAVLALCLAFFCVSFVYSLVSESHSQKVQTALDSSDLLPSGALTENGLQVSASVFQELPVASISDPIVLKVDMSYPDYLVAVSLLGFISLLLLLNWFSRTKT